MAKKSIQFTRAWGLHTKGAIVQVDAPIADLLIQNRRAVEVSSPAKPSAQPASRKNKK